MYESPDKHKHPHQCYQIIPLLMFYGSGARSVEMFVHHVACSLWGSLTWCLARMCVVVPVKARGRLHLVVSKCSRQQVGGVRSSYTSSPSEIRHALGRRQRRLSGQARHLPKSRSTSLLRRRHEHPTQIGKGHSPAKRPERAPSQQWISCRGSPRGHESARDVRGYLR